MLSIGCLFFFIASLPEIIDSVKLKQGIVGENHLLNDKASGIFNGFVAFGAIISPMIGGFLSDNIGYRYTNDSFACLSLVYTAIFGLVYMMAPKLKSISTMSTSLKEKGSADTKQTKYISMI